MLTNIAGLSFKIAENVYHFISAPNGTFAEIKEVLSQLTAHIVSAEAQAKAQQASQVQAQAEPVAVPEAPKE